MRLAVVPVAFVGEVQPETAMVEQACALFRHWSDGAFAIAAEMLPPLCVDEPASRFSALGGMTALGGPRLAGQAAARLHHAAASAPHPRSTLLLVARGAFHSHCWRVPAEAGGARYALVPNDAPALTVAHELGHLLLGWADAPGVGAHCLMGAGTGPPGAWLRVAAGWAVRRAVTSATTARQIGIGAWNGLLLERRDDVLLAWSAADRVRAIRLAPQDHDRPVLALLAAHGVHPRTPEHTTRETSR